MKITEKSKGRHLKCELVDTILYFEEGSVCIDLAAEQKGYDSVIDICVDNNGKLVKGVSDWYAAQVFIPGRKFSVRENGVADAMGFRQIIKKLEPLDTDDVVITLWAMEDK